MRLARNGQLKFKPARIISIVILVVSLWFMQAHESYAAFSLSVSPYDGGIDLRFANIIKTTTRISKEVNIRVTSDIGKQYRVIQTYAPLTNSRGVSIPSKAVKVYTLRGSNSVGTLGYDVESWVNTGPMIIYTSDSTGRSDSFVIVYSLEIPENQEPGLYRGRLIFSLEPIGSSTQSPVTKTLDMTVEIESLTKFEVITATGSKTLKLRSSADSKNRIQEVKIKINGFLGSQYRIIQKVSSPLRDSSGKFAPPDIVLMSARGAGQGRLGVTSATPLSGADVLLYTSDLRGSPDEFTLAYALNDKDLKSGVFRGALTYIVESSIPLKQGGIIEILQIEVDIKPIFDLVVSTDNAGKISFRNLKPGRPAQTSTSYIEVKTNTNKPYQVIQKVSSLLVNEKGKIIPEGYFKLKTESREAPEGLGYPSESPVKKGQMVLYTSRDGKPVKFKVIYKLDIPLDIQSGNYSTGITYSLLEL
jgi:hypothetical protein